MKLRHKRGTAFKYSLSEAASIKIVVTERVSGKRRGRSCVAPIRKLRKARKCTRTITLGTLTRISHRGANTVAFSGRIGSRALKPGRYQARITAIDTARHSSRPQTLTFTIVTR